MGLPLAAGTAKHDRSQQQVNQYHCGKRVLEKLIARMV
jgi:hypothetical protein